MIYFLTPVYLKQNTPVGDGVDTNNLDYLIKVAADTFVRSYLGTYFYQDLLGKFNNQTLNANEITLVQDYVKDAVAWRAATESVLHTSFQLKNKGVQAQSGDFSASPEFKTIAFLYEKCRDKAEFYDSRLVDFLSVKANRELYPEFISTLNTDSKIRGNCSHCSSGGGCNCSNVNAFQSGIIII